MPTDEKKDRLRGLKHTIEDLDVHNWANNFLSDLNR
jgi:trehalose-6-phosphate synthase